MDSVSQIALGAAVSVAVMGRRTAVWKSALWGAVAGTLPDLDVLVDHGDPIRNMVLHRAESHAVFWQTLFSLPFAALVARLHGETAAWRRWWLAMWLALVTHALLDAMTVYGTRLALPFSDHPFGVGSVFIIDPLFTLPLLAGTGWALAARGGARALAANAAGLALGTAYLAWGVLAQQHVERVARAALAAQGIAAERVLVTPTPFNSVLWRIVAMEGAHYHEGFRSLLDAGSHVAFDRFPSGAARLADVAGIDGVRRLTSFSHGFWKLHEEDGRVLLSDLRMGQEPDYVFTFAVARHSSPPVPVVPPEQVGSRPDVRQALAWLWRRALGEPLPPRRPGGEAPRAWHSPAPMEGMRAMSKIFSIRPVGADTGETPVSTDGTRGLRDVLRLIEGDGPVTDFAAAVPYTDRTAALMREIAGRYGFERLPATWSELYGLFEYCDSLDAASGAGMMAPDQLAEWRKASFEVWRRKQPGLMPAIERFCAGDRDGLRELHRREDTLARLGERYLESR